MPKANRALAFPYAFSVMVGTATKQVVTVLRVLASTKTYRASVADVTRRLIEKGMAVEAAEHALTYATGRPVELVTGLYADVRTAMADVFPEGLPGTDADEILRAVLGRMWPEVVQAAEKIDATTPAGRKKLVKLLAPPPLTAQGRPQTAKEIRARALEDVIAGRADPKLVPPRNVQEAQEQARLQSAADRVAMQRGVSARQLLADTPGGRMAGFAPADESAAARGWAPDHEVTTGGPRPYSRDGADEAEAPSVGEMLKQIRGGL